jgi:hypothetical protein
MLSVVILDMFATLSGLTVGPELTDGT